MKYEEVRFPSPDKIKVEHKTNSVLIIGCGHSVSDILKYKNKIKEHFDFVIGANRSFIDFDDVLDYHLISEKTSLTNGYDLAQILKDKKYSRSVKRIINYKGIEFYSKDLNIFKCSRQHKEHGFNIRDYKCGGGEGLLVGLPGPLGQSTGTVILSAIHLASIFGAKQIYLVGADLCFKDNFDHYYKDRAYRDGKMGKLNHKIITAENGFKTTEFFNASAKTIDEYIKKDFSKSIEIFDFSGGLLKAPKKLNIMEFKW